MRKMKQNVHKKHPVKHSKKINDITMASAIKNRNAMEETVMRFGKWSILPIKAVWFAWRHFLSSTVYLIYHRDGVEALFTGTW